MGTPRPSFLDEFEPMGMRLMLSTPHATATSTAPEAIRLAARLAACWLDPHWVSTVVAAVVSGRPAASQAVRAMLKDCSPTWETQPDTTCPTSDGSIPVRPTSDVRAVPSRSAGWTVERPPLRRPTGVRTASMITTSGMAGWYRRRAAARSVTQGPANGHTPGGQWTHGRTAAAAGPGGAGLPPRPAHP